MQMNMPKFQLAHRGSAFHVNLAHIKEPTDLFNARLFLLQSQQLLFCSSFTNCLSVFRFRSAVFSATARRDIFKESKICERQGVALGEL
jgi:hypothetical protein